MRRAPLKSLAVAGIAIRAELTAAGIVVEIAKDGVRWKRK
jgi:hypothetical protein